MERTRLVLLAILLLIPSYKPQVSQAQDRPLSTGTRPLPVAVKEFQQPNAYAVVIGIGQYREEVIPKVSYAVQDAQAIAGLLEAQAGIPKTHIKLLTDARATLSDLRNHLGDWLRMRVKADSTVYVYYAGHGTPNLQTQSGAIVPWDGHPDFPSGLYPLKELEDTLSKLPTKNVVVFLDSCFSGGAGRSVIAKGARPMGLQYPVLSQGEVMVLAAATGTQISSDYDKAGHGLFTHYLLAGLQGEADADKDGLVTLKEITPFVRDRVAHTAVEELNREQTPVLLPGAERLGKRDALPLARAGSAKPAASAQMASAQAKPSAALGQVVQERQTSEKQKLEEERQKLQAEREQIEQEKLATERAKLQHEKDMLAEERRQLAEERAAKAVQEARLRPFAGGSAAGGASAGDRVLGQWHDGLWYPATISSASGNGLHLAFDDGDRRTANPSQVRPIDWNVGTRVQCNWKGRGKYYPGVIGRKDGDQVFINYNDGDKELTTIGRCRSS